ncbi:hypothetical protein ACKUVQ_00300 [Mycobacterium seoulense]|uniref:hypothetical protein n=1 Tax=Mycobacterium seoulense TaxID=386911 RepID=UPI003CF799EF
MTTSMMSTTSTAIIWATPPRQVAPRVMCRRESLGVPFRSVATVDDALRLAAQERCGTSGCLGGHTVVHRDEHGRLWIVADEGDAAVDRCTDLLRVRERRRRLRARVEAARQQRRRARKTCTTSRKKRRCRSLTTFPIRRS